MATRKQKVAIKEMVENGGNISKAMRKAGYSPTTSKTPSKLTKSKGFYEICEESGLGGSLIVKALVEDIKKKKGRRVAELTLASRILGLMIDRNQIEFSRSDKLDEIGEQLRQSFDSLKDK